MAGLGFWRHSAKVAHHRGDHRGMVESWERPSGAEDAAEAASPGVAPTENATRSSPPIVPADSFADLS